MALVSRLLCFSRVPGRWLVLQGSFWAAMLCLTFYGWLFHLWGTASVRVSGPSDLRDFVVEAPPPPASLLLGLTPVGVKGLREL